MIGAPPDLEATMRTAGVVVVLCERVGVAMPVCDILFDRILALGKGEMMFVCEKRMCFCWGCCSCWYQIRLFVEELLFVGVE